MVATVSARCVIGVDVGGTKLLAGVVDEELNMRHRAQRSSQELSGPALLDALGDAGRAAVVLLDDCQWADEPTIKLLGAWQRRPVHPHQAR